MTDVRAIDVYEKLRDECGAEPSIGEYFGFFQGYNPLRSLHFPDLVEKGQSGYGSGIRRSLNYAAHSYQLHNVCITKCTPAMCTLTDKVMRLASSTLSPQGVDQQGSDDVTPHLSMTFNTFLQKWGYRHCGCPTDGNCGFHAFHGCLGKIGKQAENADREAHRLATEARLTLRDSYFLGDAIVDKRPVMAEVRGKWAQVTAASDTQWTSLANLACLAVEEKVFIAMLPNKCLGRKNAMCELMTPTGCVFNLSATQLSAVWEQLVASPLSFGVCAWQKDSTSHFEYYFKSALGNVQASQPLEEGPARRVRQRLDASSQRTNLPGRKSITATSFTAPPEAQTDSVIAAIREARCINGAAKAHIGEEHTPSVECLAGPAGGRSGKTDPWSPIDAFYDPDNALKAADSPIPHKQRTVFGSVQEKFITWLEVAIRTAVGPGFSVVKVRLIKVGNTSQKFHRDVSIDDPEEAHAAGFFGVWVIQGSRTIQHVDSHPSIQEMRLVASDISFFDYSTVHRGTCLSESHVGGVGLHFYVVRSGADPETILGRPIVFPNPLICCPHCLECVFDQSQKMALGCSCLVHVPCFVDALISQTGGVSFCQLCRHDPFVPL
jgi:hypothetical protein